MFFLENLANFIKQMAQCRALYLTFAIFGIINYLLALAYEVYVNHNSNGITFKLIVLLPCFIHLLKKHWPQGFKKFLLLFWYLAITISVPIRAILMLFVSGNHIVYQPKG